MSLPPDLLAILQGAMQNSPPGGGSQFMPPATGQMASPIAPTPQDQMAAERQRLMQEANSFTPEALPNEPKSWQQIIAGLADALSTYGAGIAGNPGLRSTAGSILDLRVMSAATGKPGRIAV